MYTSAEKVEAADLLARTQEEPLRQVVEEIVGRDCPGEEPPVAWCRKLLDGIEVRACRETAAELQRKLSRGEAGTGDDLNRALREKQKAVEEAQRRQGKLDLKRSL